MSTATEPGPSSIAEEQRMEAPPAGAPEPRSDTPPLATFGRRLGAFAIDNTLVFAAALVPVGFGLVSGSDAAAFAIMMLLGLVVLPTYFIMCDALCGGRTVGKALVGIAVTRLDGSQAGIGQSVGRELSRLMMFVFGITAYADHLLALGRETRTVHDRLAGTIVVARPVSDRGTLAAWLILAVTLALTLASWVYDVVITPASSIVVR